jgi:small-conductance mechanosensitive channel
MRSGGEKVEMESVANNWTNFAWASATILSAGLLGFIVISLVLYIAARLVKPGLPVIYGSLLGHCRKPLRLFVPLLAVFLAVPFLDLPEKGMTLASRVSSAFLVAAFAWLLVGLVSVLEDLVLARYDIGVKDNLQARKIATQMHVVKRILIAVIFVLALGSLLMQVERLREIGTGLLASAGLAGIVIGFAAQRTVANLLAGVQIAFSQPIRVDDVGIVENEWGRIEEITLTYVVVRIWDMRRLIVPISYFIEKPFQNWTRASADILGTVFIHVDYTVPVGEVRNELHRVLKESDRWDGRVWGLVVTNATERSMELRALMSAPDSGTAWDLRCEVREKLIDYLQREYPGSLPKVRYEPGSADRSKDAAPRIEQ